MVEQKSRRVTKRPGHSKQKTGTFFEHLEELSIRLRNSALILLAFSSVGLFFAETILAFLIAPYGERLKVLGPTEGVSTLIKVGLSVGAALSSPFIIYQIINSYHISG